MVRGLNGWHIGGKVRRLKGWQIGWAVSSRRCRVTRSIIPPPTSYSSITHSIRILVSFWFILPVAIEKRLVKRRSTKKHRILWTKCINSGASVLFQIISMTRVANILWSRRKDEWKCETCCGLIDHKNNSGPHEQHDNNSIACVSNTATTLPAKKIWTATTSMLPQYKDTRTQTRTSSRFSWPRTTTYKANGIITWWDVPTWKVLVQRRSFSKHCSLWNV